MHRIAICTEAVTLGGQNDNFLESQGSVTVSGAICPFLYVTFRLKRVNDEKYCMQAWSTH